LIFVGRYFRIVNFKELGLRHGKIHFATCSTWTVGFVVLGPHVSPVDIKRIHCTFIGTTTKLTLDHFPVAEGDQRDKAEMTIRRELPELNMSGAARMKASGVDPQFGLRRRRTKRETPATAKDEKKHDANRQQQPIQQKPFEKLFSLEWSESRIGCKRERGGLAVRWFFLGTIEKLKLKLAKLLHP
jgi:hypothetical protein